MEMISDFPGTVLINNLKTVLRKSESTLVFIFVYITKISSRDTSLESSRRDDSIDVSLDDIANLGKII